MPFTGPDLVSTLILIAALAGGALTALIQNWLDQ